jgi:hypothetical protein
MTDTRTLAADSAIDRIFGPVIQAQTWINMLYLLISFPLGVAYFVVLVTMLSAGVGMAVIVVGFFILWFGLMAADVLSELDRTVINTMLGTGIPPRAQATAVGGPLHKHMLATAKRPGTIRRVIYLFLRFPLGVAGFILVMVLIPLSVVFLTAPLTYSFIPIQIGVSTVETFDQAIYICCFGAVFTLVSVHLINSWTAVCRRFAKTMLTQ